MRMLIALIVMAFIAWPRLSLAGDPDTKGETAAEGTTVKSGKSNSSDRVGGAGSANPVEATTVKSSKSNSSERVGAAGNTSDEAGSPNQATTVKGSKSNSSE